MNRPNERLKNAIRWARISQRELAERCGTSEVSISRYVNGKRIPNIYMAMKIARSLSLNVYDLWSTQDEQ